MLLSIVIPIYNVEPYIERCLHSIFSQSESLQENQVEVIAVNDGTPDHSMDIVKDFALRHKNLHVINQENQGLSCARNAGLEKAVGKYIWFVDSDDCITTKALQQLLPWLSQTIDIIAFDIEIRQKEKIIYQSVFYKSRWRKHYNTIHPGNFFGKKVDVSICPKFLYRRDFLNENNIRFYPHILHEDTEINPRCFHYAQTMICIPVCAYIYMCRVAGSIMTSGFNFKSVTDCMLIIQNWEKEAEKCLSKSERDLFHDQISGMCYFILAIRNNSAQFQSFLEENKSVLKKKMVLNFIKSLPKYFSLGRCQRVFCGLLK